MKKKVSIIIVSIIIAAMIVAPIIGAFRLIPAGGSKHYRWQGYVVKDGDTITGISKMVAEEGLHGRRNWKEVRFMIVHMNDIPCNGDVIHPGDFIEVPILRGGVNYDLLPMWERP